MYFRLALVACFAVAMATLQSTCDSADTCDEDTNSLIQHRGTIESRNTKHSAGKRGGAKIAILTTPGGKDLCCGLPSSAPAGTPLMPTQKGDEARCESERGSTRNWQMAMAVKSGAQAVCPDCQVDVISINKEDEPCPDAKALSIYDGIIVGAPTWAGAPSPDMMQYLAKYWRPYKSLPGKVGGAFTTGSDYFGGLAEAIGVIQREMLMYQFLVVGTAMAGGAGEFLPGAAAGLGGLHYADSGYPDHPREPFVHQQFLDEARALGARVANVTVHVKGIGDVFGTWCEDQGGPCDFLGGFEHGQSPGFFPPCCKEGPPPNLTDCQGEAPDLSTCNKDNLGNMGGCSKHDLEEAHLLECPCEATKTCCCGSRRKKSSECPDACPDDDVPADGSRH